MITDYLEVKGGSTFAFFILLEFKWKSTVIKPLDYDKNIRIYNKILQGYKSSHLLKLA